MVTTATACGKAILLGEHAVVYGQPAIAVPVSGVRAAVEIIDLPAGSGIHIAAHDLGLAFALQDCDLPPAALPLQTTLRNTLDHLALDASSLACRMDIRSRIPVARGMGSGTAVATALVRGLAAYLGRTITTEAISRLVYQTEILLHGTPSGIDNTVVAYEQPVYYVKGKAVQMVRVGAPMSLVIGDTGVPSETKAAVEMVRRCWQGEPARYEVLFAEMGEIAAQARLVMAEGQAQTLGALMNQNQQILATLGVSSPELEYLISAARAAGAWGAKLSGGGRGGCMIALCSPTQQTVLAQTLWDAGAAAVFTTQIG